MRYFKLAGLSACLAGSLVLSACNSKDKTTANDQKDAQYQQIASPEHWEDQVIYFVMTDRFNDGDPSNNDQGAGEYDPQSLAKYSGGDLRGIEQKIDYIKGLGATAVWITPPVENQWWDPVNQYGGYHGYWARNFMKVDPHVGTLDDYKSLSRQLHKNGMYLIQDAIVNHMANCFYWDNPQSEYDPNHPTNNVKVVANAQPACGPTQAPFDQWDPRNPDHVAANIFHWTPKIMDYNDPNQEQNYQMSDLDDLNTDNPVVVKAIKDSYAYWIKNVGVDALRLDTAFYVTPGFYDEFMHSSDATSPGMMAAAKAAGKNNFYAFGEGFGIDMPYENTQARKIDKYMSDPNTGKAILPGMINFPMYGSMLNVFAKGQPTAELGYRMRNQMTQHARPHLMPNFLDSHDVDRYLTGGSEKSLRQGLMFMMSSPGIPVIYYGTEQGFTEQRGAMFSGGYQSGGKNHFDTTAPLYTYMAEVTKMRKDYPVLSRGIPTVLKENASSDGAFAYRMDYNGQSMLVVFNTSDSAVLMDNVDTGLLEGAELKLIKSLTTGATDSVIGKNGRLTMALPARAGMVFNVSGNRLPVPGAGVAMTVNAISTDIKTTDFAIGGTATGVSQVKIVVDGILDDAQTVAVNNGLWTATVPIAGMVDAAVTHTVVAYDATSSQLSNSASFKVQASWTLLATHNDVASDDNGPLGTYHYPTDNSWGTNHQGDIRKVTLEGSGPVLRIGVTTNQITKTWNPANGFDHVAFSIYVDVPNKTGLSLMPGQNTHVPTGMDWDLKIRTHGWANVMYSTTGATATQDGAAIIPAAKVEVDENTNTVYFTVSKKALGLSSSLSGVKVYATTWDYDGGYRGLSPTTQQWQFWGGAATDPLVLDDTPVLVVP